MSKLIQKMKKHFLWAGFVVVLATLLWEPVSLHFSPQVYDAGMITRRLTERLYEKYGASPPDKLYPTLYGYLQQELDAHKNLYETHDPRRPYKARDITEKIWAGILNKAGASL